MTTKGEITKRNILIQSLTLFSKKGVQNVTTQEIADAVGIKQTGIYRYFKDLDQLLAEAIELAAEEGRIFFQSHTPENLGAKELLLITIENNLKWVIKEKPYNVGFLSVHYFSTQISAIEKVQHTITETRTNRFLNIIHQGVREKVWKVKDPEKAAITVHNFLTGEMLLAYNNPKSETLAERIARVQKAVFALIAIH